MNIRRILFYFFLTCMGASVAAFMVLLPGLIWPDSMILFGLLALILFLYLVLPAHALAFFLLIYASVKYRVFTRVLGYYLYLIIWCAINAAIFEEYLFTELPEKFEHWRYEQKYENELTLIRAFNNGQGSSEKVEELLAKDIDPNVVDSYSGIPALSWAALSMNGADAGHMERIEQLLDMGAQINYQTDIVFGGGPKNIVQLSIATPLALATLNRDALHRFEISSVLLDRGADPRIGEPVLGACGYADIPLLELLINSGADLWVKDPRGRGCLHYAASSGAHQLVSFLLEKQKGIIVDDKEVPNPVDIAASKEHTGVVIQLIKAGYNASEPVRLERLLKSAPDTVAKEQLRELLAESAKTSED